MQVLIPMMSFLVLSKYFGQKHIKSSKVIGDEWGGQPINNKVGHVFRQKAAVALMVICG